MNSSNSKAESINPLEKGNRIFGFSSYILMFWASLISIQALAIGQGMLAPNGSLNLLQGLLVIGIAGIIQAFFMSLNGHIGMRLGIPFCIQVRSTFGIKGARFPELTRILPAILWYGVTTWFAAQALDGIIESISGFSTPLIVYFYFVGLQVIQTVFAYYGLKVMKSFETTASIVMVVIMGYMIFEIFSNQQPILVTYWNHKGSWGLPFFQSINVLIGAGAAIIVSSSDLTRYVKPGQKNLWVGHILGVIPPLFFVVFLGLISTAVTGTWDPVGSLMELSPNPTVMIVLLIFLILAQFSTNLTMNILPPALILEETVGVNWKIGVIITGIFGLLTVPWIILKSPDLLYMVVEYYSAFFGPILGCMLVENLTNKGAYLTSAYYDTTKNGAYWYYKGVNWRAVIITILVSAFVMIFFLELSWLIGLPLSMLIYWITNKRKRLLVEQLKGNNN